ncbi:MAG: accessory factor UbiK family protein [Pseudomonadota bacterium]
MTTGPNKIFDDFARLMTDAAGAAKGAQREVEAMFQAQAERFMSSMDMVQREEFDAMRDLAVNAANENETLKEQIAALEVRIAALETKK